MMSTFRYISSKLARRNMYLEFILDDSHNDNYDDNNQGCILIPLRPLSCSEQSFFTKISIRARTKFPSFGVQTRSLDRGALASSSSSPSSSASFSLDAPAAATNKQSRQNSRRTTKHDYIFQAIDPMHLLHHSEIPHHAIFRADGLLVLNIDSPPSSSSSLNDGDEEEEEKEEEGEEFILHSCSSWSAACGEGPGGGGGGGDMFESPIYGFGLRDYFQNIHSRLGRVDDTILATSTMDTTTDIHGSEDGVTRNRRNRSRGRRDNNDDDINTVVKGASGKRLETRPTSSRVNPKGKELSSTSSPASSSLFNNSRNKAYPSTSSSSSSSSLSSSLLLPQTLAPPPCVMAPHHRATTTSSSTSSTSSTSRSGGRSRSGNDNYNNKTFFEFALSEYPLYRRSESDLGGGAHPAAAAVTAAGGGRDYDPLKNYLMEEGELVDKKDGWGVGEGMSTTIILGSEWEAFRRIGLGVGG